MQNPYAEVDFKTSGGHDEYNAMMLSLNKRSASGLATNVQYTLGRSRGTSGGSNEANTAGNNALTLDQFEYENGYNNFDVRHTFNLSVLYSVPFGHGRASAASRTLTQPARWLGRASSTLAAVCRPVQSSGRHRYQDATAHLRQPCLGPHASSRAGCGASRTCAAPPIPGVDPFIKDGGLLFLNPAAFATPAPGTFGNLERNSIHGPGSKQVDMFFAKHFNAGARRDIEFRAEVFNMFDTVNFSNPIGTLPQAIPTAALTEANRVQPGQPYTAAAAGTFGRLSSTVGRTAGLGTPRQIQFAVRFSF